jgi:NAD(P)-dependent dehydrogenase (short-subunit alcohol dehydrogenase family)
MHSKRQGATVTAAGLGDGTQLDVTDNEAVKALVHSLPSLDILVNAAGVIRRDAEFEIDTFSEVIDINLTGAMRACMAAPRTSEAVERLHREHRLDADLLRRPASAGLQRQQGRPSPSSPGPWRWPGRKTASASTPSPRMDRNTLDPSAPRRPGPLRPMLSRTPMGRWGKPDEVAVL